ncbi:hypothetical protein Dimus_001299 [Dionaea muscipula]
MENRRRKLENLLPHQLEFLKKKTMREFVGSGDLIKMVSPLILHCIFDGYLMAVAECRQTLERAGNLNHVEDNLNVDYEPEPPSSPIILDPILWNADGLTNPLVYVKKWGQELLHGPSGYIRPEKWQIPPPSIILKDKAP